MQTVLWMQAKKSKSGWLLSLQETPVQLLAAEILIILVISAMLCAGLLWLVQTNSSELVRGLILR
jgi:hypothetical protein